MPKPRDLAEPEARTSMIDFKLRQCSAPSLTTTINISLSDGRGTF